MWDNVPDGKVKPVISEELLAEFNEVIVRSQFKRYLRRNRLAKFQRILIQTAEISKVKIHLHS